MRARQLRSLVLAALSLALVAALFLIYQYRETKTAPILFSTPVAAPTPSAAPVTLPKPDGGTLTVGSEQVAIGGGGEMRCELYDESGNPRGRLVAAEWRPLGERSLELEVKSPRIRVHTPAGPIIELSSDRGVIERKSTDLTRMEMKTAELQGAVKITIDRLSNAQRKALADDPAAMAEVDPDRFINIEMDDLYFDLEFARVQTQGPFHVKAAEAEIRGRGLNVRYNELESRVEELNITSGERVIVWNLNDRFRVAGLGAGPKEEPADAPSSAPTPSPIPTPTPAPETESAEDDLPPLLAEDEPRKPRQRPTDVYNATFAGDVRITQFEADADVGRLVADELRILFDFSQRERELARQAPGSAEPAETGAPEARAIDRSSRIELTWSGPMSVTSQRLAPATEGAAPAQRMHLTATGERVEVRDAQREVTCRKLVYASESESVELTGTAEVPAHVRMRDAGELIGREIILERDAGKARARGPGGRLVAALEERGGSAISGLTGGGHPAPLEVLFESDVAAEFTRVEVERFDIRTAKTEMVQREMLKSTVFTGQVRMTRGDDRFEGERIEIDFALDPNGKQYPTHVRAFDRVVAAQGERYIRAADRLNVVLELIEQPSRRPPFNLAKAREAAAVRGEDPDAIDWTAVRKRYGEQRDYQPGLRTLEAIGQAEVRDPHQQLEIDCDQLMCQFTGGREIQSGLVTPRAGGNAYVALGAFSISAPTPIPFDAFAQTATVDGPGRMTFPSRQDIDGRVLEEPMIVGIQWTQRMAFNGADNEAIFRGEVRAETQRSRFACETLRIDFADVAPVGENAIAARTDSPQKWWLLQPLVERAASDDRAETFSLTGPTVNKKPVYLYATGQVSGESANNDERSGQLRNRVRFAGPILAVDLRKRALLIDGPGNLLIEDYRPAKPGSGVSRDESRGLSPFGKLAGSEPSQTFMAWETSMRYNDADSTAEFLKDVTLQHSTGARMKHAAEFIGQAAAAGGEGRDAKLNCQSLNVRFARGSRPSGKNAGTSPMSGTEVDSFVADGRVYFADSGISAIANRISYDRSSGALDILGTDSAPAELFDQRKRFSSFKGPHFTWNRKTNQILAPKSRGRVN